MPRPQSPLRILQILMHQFSTSRFGGGSKLVISWKGEMYSITSHQELRNLLTDIVRAGGTYKNIEPNLACHLTKRDDYLKYTVLCNMLFRGKASSTSTWPSIIYYHEVQYGCCINGTEDGILVTKPSSELTTTATTPCAPILSLPIYREIIIRFVLEMQLWMHSSGVKGRPSPPAAPPAKLLYCNTPFSHHCAGWKRYIYLSSYWPFDHCLQVSASYLD